MGNERERKRMRDKMECDGKQLINIKRKTIIIVFYMRAICDNSTQITPETLGNRNIHVFDWASL